MASRKKQRTIRDSLFKVGQAPLELEVAYVVATCVSTTNSNEGGSKVDVV